MNLSDSGLGLLKQREGTVPTMYRDSAGLPSIGVGHLLTKSELLSGKLQIGTDFFRWADGLTDDQVEWLLLDDLEPTEAAVESLVTVALTQVQFDTLCSFVFNVGPTAFRNSTLLRLLNAGEYAAVPGQLRRWVFAGGKKDPILVRRREEEAQQWTSREVP